MKQDRPVRRAARDRGAQRLMAAAALLLGLGAAPGGSGALVMPAQAQTGGEGAAQSEAAAPEAIPLPEPRPDTDAASEPAAPAASDDAPTSGAEDTGTAPERPSGTSAPDPAEAQGGGPGTPETTPETPETSNEAAPLPAGRAAPVPEAKPDMTAPAEDETPADRAVPQTDAPSAQGQARPSQESTPNEASPAAGAETPPAPAPTNRDRDTAPLGWRDVPAAQLPVTPSAAVRAAAAVADAIACERELTRRGVRFTVAATISEGRCGVLRPIRVTALSNGLTVSPATALWCTAARALDDWGQSGLAPAAKAALPGRRLIGLRHASTYVCRDRGSGTKISEHARGSAIDIAAFVFEDGEIAVAPQAKASAEAAFQRRAREAACGPFTTVLGPGTDADHAGHFHLDLAARTNRAYCR